MRLFHLVEQHDAIRTAAHGFGQLAALVITDISRRGTDQTGDTVLFHVFAHVDTNHVLFIVKQRLRQRLGQLSLANARRTKEEERADRPVRVLDAGTAAQDGLADLFDRLILTDDALVERIIQMQQFFALAFHQFGNRDARPAGDDAGDFFLGHLVAQQRAVALGFLGDLLLVGQLFLKLRQLAVFQLGGAIQIIIALGFGDFAAHMLDFLAELLHLADGVFLVFPPRLHGVKLLAHIGQLFLNDAQALTRERVVLLFERGLLDFMLHDAAAHVVQLLRHGIHLGANGRTGLIHQVDGLIRQKTIRNIAIGERRGGDQRLIGDFNAVEDLVALFQAAQNGDRILNRRLGDHDGLETAFQRRVLLDIFAILVQRRRADAMQLAARQHRLEQVARIHAALGFARAHNGMQLVDEQDDAAVAGLDVVQNGFQALLKLAAEFRAGNQRAHIQREDGAVFQAVRHVAANNALRKPLGDGRFADARFADQHRVVFRFAGKNTDGVSDFGIAADHRIELVLTSKLNQILTVFFQRVIRRFRIFAGHARAAANGLQRLQKFRLGDIQRGKQRANRAVRFFKQTEEKVLDGNILVAHLLHLVFGLRERLRKRGGHIRLLIAAGNLRQAVDGAFAGRPHLLNVKPQFAHQLADQAVFLTEQGIEQMNLFNLRVAVALRKLLSGLQGLQGFLGEAVRIHPNHPPLYSGAVGLRPLKH